MIPWRSELICWSANWRNLINGLSDFDRELSESFPGSEDEAISHAVFALGDLRFEVIELEG